MVGWIYIWEINNSQWSATMVILKIIKRVAIGAKLGGLLEVMWTNSIASTLTNQINTTSKKMFEYYEYNEYEWFIYV